MLITSKKYLHNTSRLVFDQTTGHHGLAILTHNNHHRVVYTFWLLWIIQLVIFVYTYLCKHVLNSLGYMPTNKMLDHMVTPYKILKNCHTFLKWLYHLTIPLIVCFSTSSTTFVICLFIVVFDLHFPVG